MADNPYWSVCVNDFFASESCAGMTGLQKAVYLMALARSWEWDGLPADKEELRDKLGLDKRWFKNHFGIVYSSFVLLNENGRQVLRHPRQEEQRHKLATLTQVRRKAGKSGGLAKAKANAKQNCSRAYLPSPSPSEDPPYPPQVGGNVVANATELEDLSADLADRFGTRGGATNPRARGENPRDDGDPKAAERYNAIKFLQDHAGMRLATGTELRRLGIDTGRSDESYSDMETKQLQSLVKNVKAVLADQAVADDKEPLKVLRDATDGQTDDPTRSD